MATYSYGKKTRVRRSGVKAIGPTSAELERQTARMASAPPIPDRVGDQQRQRNIDQWNRFNGGRDGGIPRNQVPGNPFAPNGRVPNRDDWRGREGLAPPGQLPHLQGRRKRGNRYYRTD